MEDQQPPTGMGTPNDICGGCGNNLAESWHALGETVWGSRRIGVIIGDRVGYWECPDCGHKWPRGQ